MNGHRKRRKGAPQPTGYVGDHADKLGRVRSMAFDDDDERPCREDLDYAHTVFTRAPPLLPRFLRGRLKPER
jgi:hypothetical protein